MIDGLISADVAEVVMGLEDELKRRNDQIVGSLLERMERDGYGGIWNINPRFDVESEAVFTMSTASADEPDWGDEPLPCKEIRLHHARRMAAGHGFALLHGSRGK